MNRTGYRETTSINVVGLPVAELTALLLRRGAIHCQLPVEAVHA